MTKFTAKTLRLTLMRSTLSVSEKHRGTIRALGFRKVHQVVEQANTPQLRGMLAKVAHMVKVEEVK